MIKTSRAVVIEQDVLGNDKDDIPQNLKDDAAVVKEVPSSRIYGHDLKRLKSYKKIRRGYKLSNQKAIFMSDISLILKEFPADKHQYDDELLVEILNIAEAYFIYGSKDDRESAKKDCIIHLLSPYFRGDIDLLFKTISHVWNKVSKTNLAKRLWARTKNFFLSTRTS